MSLEQSFNDAVEFVKNGQPSRKLSNDEKLKTYALFKQATEGNVHSSRPGMFNVTARAKWDAWEKEKGKSKEEAMQEYVDLVERFR